MSELTYIYTKENHIDVILNNRGKKKNHTRAIRLPFSDFESKEACLAHAKTVRDQAFMELYGVAFDPNRTTDLNPNKNAQTGVIGVSPFVSVKQGKTKPAISTGYTVSVTFEGTRIRRTYSHKHEDKESVMNAFRKAVHDSYRYRGLPVPDEKLLKILYTPISWKLIIKEKLERIEEKKKERA